MGLAKAFGACAAAVAAILLMGAGDAARFNSLGHKIICSCGCNQILLECNHVGCPRSDGMRNELAAGLARGDSDDLALQAFVQKYGTIILAAPPVAGFNRLAWIMPFAVLIAGFVLAFLMARRWKARNLRGEPAAGDGRHEPLRATVRRETEE